MSNVKLVLGDCLDKLKELEDNSVDSIVTDPPYGLSFMGKQWDYDVPSQQIWGECLRVLKPGGHLLSFAGSRTYHRMAVRIEDAGFEIRDQIMWIYGSGFPKSHNIGKAVDKLQGNEREVVGISKNDRPNSQVKGGRGFDSAFNNGQEHQPIIDTKGNSPYEGWGTALKPAHEPIVMARKPFKGSVAENVLEWGTGGINIDGSRIGMTEEDLQKTDRVGTIDKTKYDHIYGSYGKGEYKPNSQGRFPANLILDEEAGKMLDEQSGVTKSGKVKENKSVYGGDSNTGFLRGVSTTENQYGDIGGASRFFYCPKVGKSERNEGTDNNHPTVKPTDLMLYLIRLVTPKGGTTLDPFMGSGSTGKSAVRGGFDFIGIEREKEYFDIAEARINWELEKPKKETKSKKDKVSTSKETQETLSKFFD